MAVPTTLWRHLLSELTKMLVITTGIMVMVIAFGAAAKPLADNEIGADLVAKYVSLATVPMLQFALPFAAGFAATLVLNRFVTDNEITAMSAAGMSYGRILAPVGILGVVLALFMFALVAFVAPGFWTRMKELSTVDATQMLAASIGRREALVADNMLIYADAVDVVPTPSDTGAVRRLVLRGVAAIELGSKRSTEPATEFTAEQAVVDVHSTESGPVAKLVLLNATVFRPGEGAIATVPRVEPGAISMQKPFYRSPKFLPLTELFLLRNDVDRALIVQQVARPLAAVAAEADLWKCLGDHLAAAGATTLLHAPSQREYRIEGARLQGAILVPAHAGGRLSITELVQGRPSRRTETESAMLSAVSEVGYTPTVTLRVARPENSRNLVDGVPARWPPRVDDLVPQGCQARDWQQASSAQVLQRIEEMPAEDGAGPYKELTASARELRARLELNRANVRYESDSHIMQRFAQSVSVGLVLLLGAVLAVWLRRALPLTVYLLAFLPAVGNILMISGGQQVMKNGHPVPGMILMWGGNVLLSLVLAVAWTRVARN